MATATKERPTKGQATVEATVEATKAPEPDFAADLVREMERQREADLAAWRLGVVQNALHIRATLTPAEFALVMARMNRNPSELAADSEVVVTYFQQRAREKEFRAQYADAEANIKAAKAKADELKAQAREAESAWHQVSWHYRHLLGEACASGARCEQAKRQFPEIIELAESMVAKTGVAE